MWQGEMWRGVKWLCALVAMSCNSVPDIATIQTAYEREASAGSTFHDNALQVLQAKCQNDGGIDKFLCEVTFISKGDPAERFSFDIVAVARAGAGWELKSGLHKR
jgi:predicted PolB exonuclease-like 3'-5' exonuclease